MGIGAGISALGSLGASLFNESANKGAAAVEAQAAQQAAAFSRQVYGDAQGNLQPYMATGSGAASSLGSQLNSLTTPFAPTQSQLETSPGFQFNLAQGLKSTQNGAAARGLGLSGAALKGASQYATGLADNTLQTQYNIDQGNKTNAYNKLLGTATLGDTSANQLGSIGNAAATGTSNALLTGAQGQASADIASGTAFNSLLGNLGNLYAVGNSQNNGLANRQNNADGNANNYYTTTPFAGFGKSLVSGLGSIF